MSDVARTFDFTSTVDTWELTLSKSLANAYDKLNISTFSRIFQT